MQNNFPIANDNYAPRQTQDGEVAVTDAVFDPVFKPSVQISSAQLAPKSRPRLKISDTIWQAITVAAILAWAVGMIFSVRLAMGLAAFDQVMSLGTMVVCLGLGLGLIGERRDKPVLREIGIITMIAAACYTSLQVVTTYNIGLGAPAMLMGGALLSAFIGILTKSNGAVILISVFSLFCTYGIVTTEGPTLWLGIAACVTLLTSVFTQKWLHPLALFCAALGFLTPVLSFVAVLALNGTVSYSGSSLAVMLFGLCYINSVDTITAQRFISTRVHMTLGFTIAVFGALLICDYWLHPTQMPWSQDALSRVASTNTSYWYIALLALLSPLVLSAIIRGYRREQSGAFLIWSTFAVLAVPLAYFFIEAETSIPYFGAAIDRTWAGVILAGAFIGFGGIVLYRTTLSGAFGMAVLAAIAISLQVMLIKDVAALSAEMMVALGLSVLISGLIGALYQPKRHSRAMTAPQ